MTEQRKLEKTKAELKQALAVLDRLEEIHLATKFADKDQTEPIRAQQPPQVDHLAETNQELQERNGKLCEEMDRMRQDRINLNNDINQLRSLSCKLQADIEKANEEKNLLSKIVKSTQGENEVLSKVMERISTDYEELKRVFDSQKCPKDDKIMALRKTARALETENELLQQEKQRVEIDGERRRQDLEHRLLELERKREEQQLQILKMGEEKKLLIERVDRVEREKGELAHRLGTVSKELEESKSQMNKVSLEKEKVNEQKTILSETLTALKDSKRVVEIKYQTVLSEKTKLNDQIATISQESVFLGVKNQSLEERLQVLEREKEEQTEILAEMQQTLVERTSQHEAKLREMQIELNRQLDEINSSKNEDVERVKENYIRLFDEKAGELMVIRSQHEKAEVELAQYKEKCRDLEYREQELNKLVNLMRERPEKTQPLELQNKIEEYEKSTNKLQEQLKRVRIAFNELKSREIEYLSKFSSEACNFAQVLHEKDAEILSLRSQLFGNAADHVQSNANQLSNRSSHNSENDPPVLDNDCRMRSSDLAGCQPHGMGKRKRKKKKIQKIGNHQV